MGFKDGTRNIRMDIEIWDSSTIVSR